MGNAHPARFMDYHLYFHNDFDGIASGAVMLDFLKGRGDKIISFNPINYFAELQKKWPKFKFKKPFILVDFRYHPKADFWFDHHLSTFISEKWKSDFATDKAHYFGPKFKSCCGLIIFHLGKQFGYRPPHCIKELVGWADMVDSASYKSAKQAVELKEPGLRLALFLADDSYPLHQEEIIKRLISESISKIVKLPFIAKELKKLDYETKRAKKIFKDISALKDKIVFVDTTKTKTFISRYMGYFLYPKIKYFVIVMRSDGGYHISAGKNPWKKMPNKIAIGEMLGKYGGGGHKGVGGVERRTKPEILKVAEEIIEYLNKHG